MFLTEEEFLVLTSLKMGLTHTQAKEKLGMTIHTNDTNKYSNDKSISRDLKELKEEIDKEIYNLDIADFYN